MGITGHHLFFSGTVSHI